MISSYSLFYLFISHIKMHTKYIILLDTCTSDQAGVVEVRVGEEQEVDSSEVKCEGLAVPVAGVARALHNAAVDEDLRMTRMQAGPREPRFS